MNERSGTYAEHVEIALSMHGELVSALTGMLAEWDKLTRYGSPMAKAANERVVAARAALAKVKGA